MKDNVGEKETKGFVKDGASEASVMEIFRLIDHNRVDLIFPFFWVNAPATTTHAG